MELLTKNWKNGTDTGIFILRIVLGFFLLHSHGWDKLSVILSGEEIQFMDPIGIGATLSYYMAGFAEGIVVILLMLGLFMRPAILILLGNFLVIFYTHTSMFGDSFLALELQNMYFFGFLALLFTGPGKYSLDSMLFSKK